MKVLLVAYDNDSYIHWFPQGLAYIAAVLRQYGHEVEIYNQDVHHYSPQHLTHYLDTNNFDVIGLNVIGGYYQYQKTLEISASIRRAKKKPFYVLGGHGPAPEPEFYFKITEADAIVIGEGELTVIELLEHVANKYSLSKVKGIAYRDGSNVIVNERRGLRKNIDTIPLPAYDLFPMEYYRLLRMPFATNHDFVFPILSGRGCIFRCNFCYRMDEGFRPRSNQAIIDEVNLLKQKYGITYIEFSDELLMSSVERTTRLCEDFLKANLNFKWACEGRLNFAKPEVLNLMKRAGCVFINYGIEAMDDQVLKNMNKCLRVDIIIRGVEETLKAKISPGLNIIFGNIGDNRETLKKDVEFLLKYDDGAQFRTIRPVTPYPGSELYYIAIKEGLIKDCEDFYVNKHKNSDLLSVNFTELSDDDFYSALSEANTTLARNYFSKKEQSILSQIENLYSKRDAGFRGFRQS